MVRPKKSAINVNVQLMQCWHIPELLKIERQSFPVSSWDYQTFNYCQDRKKFISLVATHKTKHQQRVVGFVIFDKTNSQVLYCAVVDGYRRLGIGKQMLEEMICKALKLKGEQIIRQIRLYVPERSLRAQFFFYAQGFRAIKVVHNHFVETKEDAYLMLYEPSTHNRSQATRSRIAQFYTQA